MFENLKKWLSGSFTCPDCGRDVKFYSMAFGFGEATCPSCYTKDDSNLYFEGDLPPILIETPIMSLDTSYFLNQLMVCLNRNEPKVRIVKSDSRYQGADLKKWK